MPYQLLLIQVLLGFLGLFLFYQTLLYTKHILLVKRLQKQPLPKRYEEILRSLPYYRSLPEKLLPKLHFEMMLFINEKEWIGAHTEVTERMKVTVAFFACLLTLGNGRRYDNLQTIYIYPYEYIIDEIKSYGGVHTLQKQVLQGQSDGSAVIVSWHSGKKQALQLRDHNVIIHEFAHELDFASGAADGVPPMEHSLYDAWAKDMFSVYDKVRKKRFANRFWGRYKLFGAYAGVSEAEFFAVATELFFQNPRALHRKFPKIYKELRRFYKLDPDKLLQGASRE